MEQQKSQSKMIQLRRIYLIIEYQKSDFCLQIYINWTRDSPYQDTFSQQTQSHFSCFSLKYDKELRITRRLKETFNLKDITQNRQINKEEKKFKGNLKSSRRTILKDLIKGKIFKIYGKADVIETEIVWTHTHTHIYQVKE